MAHEQLSLSFEIPFYPYLADDEIEWEYVCDNPDCGHVKRATKKRLIAVAIKSLIKLVFLSERYPLTPFFHLDQFNVLAKDRNFSQLKHWKMVEEGENVESKKRKSGMYRPTSLGIDFVHGKIKAPKCIITMENELLGYQGPDVTIVQAAKLDFDYQELIDENQMATAVYRIEKPYT